MPSDSSHNLESRAPDRRLVGLLASLIVLSGLLIIAGWVFRVPLLRGDYRGTLVAPNTALLFCLTGISTLLQMHSRGRIPGRALGAFVAVFGAAIFVQHVTGADFGIDDIFLRSRLSDWYLPNPAGRVSASTSLAFVLTGIHLAFQRTQRPLPLDISAGGVLTVAYVALLGYLYGVQPFYGYLMALPTALLLLLTGVLLVAAADHSWLRLMLTSSEAGGMVLRRLGPVAMLALPLLGWLRLQLQNYGLVPLEFGTALFVAAMVLLFTVVGLRTAATLNRVDAQRKTAQAALIRTEKLAAAGRLAATVAHEINNPLAAALNSVYLARSEPGSAQEYLQTAERELRRVAAVARQSLGFYRGQGRPEVVLIRTVLTEVVAAFRAVANAKGIHLTIEHSAEYAVFAESGEMYQIFSNLIANAVDAIQDGGNVTVAVYEHADKFVTVKVEDDGCGIPESVMEHVFEPFFTTKPIVGTGLGLFVVKDLVAKNKGSVNIQSKVGPEDHGTSVSVVLPAAIVEPANRSQTAAT